MVLGVCLDPRGLLPPRRPIYWPNDFGAPLELDTRNQRNQLGPPCKPAASSWNCQSSSSSRIRRRLRRSGKRKRTGDV